MRQPCVINACRFAPFFNQIFSCAHPIKGLSFQIRANGAYPSRRSSTGRSVFSSIRLPGRGRQKPTVSATETVKSGAVRIHHERLRPGRSAPHTAGARRQFCRSPATAHSTAQGFPEACFRFGSGSGILQTVSCRLSVFKECTASVLITPRDW